MNLFRQMDKFFDDIFEQLPQIPMVGLIISFLILEVML
jgi:hypothetical protein